MTKTLRPLLAGNWKMNGTRESLTQLKAIAAAITEPQSDKVETLLCPPLTLLYVATALCEDSPMAIGAQDCHQEISGAHTGDVSAEMIADCFGTYVIVGHSERRRDHGETSEMVRAKALSAHAVGLTTIICIGETAEQRKTDRTIAALHEQIGASVPEDATAENTVIAYEPVWAIGTGVTPQPDEIAAAHAAMRADLVGRFGKTGERIRLLYGGSANPGNTGSLAAIANVNGLLVGGASLKADDFIAMYRAYLKVAASQG
jgi:triosephosphate isomerase